MDNLTPEQIQLLMEAGLIPEQLSELDSQYAQAQALRETPNPEGRQAGRVYVAASPLEHIAAMLRRGRGRKDMKSVEEQRALLLKKQADARSAYGQQILSPSGQPLPQPMGSRENLRGDGWL